MATFVRSNPGAQPEARRNRRRSRLRLRILFSQTSDAVGPNGKVIAEDIRRLSLAFLWMRALRKGKHNVRVLLGDVDDPQLDPNSVNAALISNTYHEFAAPGMIMDHVRQSLVPGGRSSLSTARQKTRRNGPMPFKNMKSLPSMSSSRVRKAMFEIDSRTDHFIESDPEHENWWMIVAHCP